MLVSAKAVTLLGHHVPLSLWTPFAYLWQDVCVALLFFVIDRGLERPALAWGVYALLVAYTADQRPRRARALHAADVDHDAGARAGLSPTPSFTI